MVSGQKLEQLGMGLADGLVLKMGERGRDCESDSVGEEIDWHQALIDIQIELLSV